MAPVILSYTTFVLLYAFATVGFITVSIHVGSKLTPYFNKLHAYVIKKGWL